LAHNDNFKLKYKIKEIEKLFGEKYQNQIIMMPYKRNRKIIW